MTHFTFPSHLRLKTTAMFKRVYDRKRSASDEGIIVYACENDLPHPRVGLSVSKKVGGAVQRNRWKRLFREAFRLTQFDLPRGVDFVLIPRPQAVPNLASLQASLLRLCPQAARKLAVPTVVREGSQ